MTKNIVASIPQVYRPIMEGKHVFYVYYGGRGGGKTQNIAQCLILLAISKKMRILCLRESQSSIAESVKHTLESWIDTLQLNAEFTIQHNSISCNNGSEFIFMGMRSHNAVNVKSIDDISVCWIEEGEAFSQRSWDLLVPSIVRYKDPRIIVSFNPYREEDALYTEFIVREPPANSFIARVNYMDNPFFDNTYLSTQRADEEKRLPAAVYRHKWLGEILREVENSLWNNGIIQKMVTTETFDRNNYTSICIGCDPATTNKDFSNEYGVCVCGITKEGIIHCIDDLSGNYNPLEFANVVNTAYCSYLADVVVVEVNNGGDFIKSTLLSVSAKLNVLEVRASSNKIQRALPVANLAHMGKVKHINSGFQKLQRQMELTTNKGYMGASGESPDRLDAYVWAVYHLAGLSDLDTESLVFKVNCVKPHSSIYDSYFNEFTDVLYVSKFLDDYVYINLDIQSDKQFNKVLNIKKAYISKDLDTKLLSASGSIRMRNSELNRALYNEALRANSNTATYNAETVYSSKLDFRAIKCREALELNTVYYDKDFKHSSHNNEYGNILNLQLLRYHSDSKAEFLLLELFFDIIIIEYNLNVKDFK